MLWKLAIRNLITHKVQTLVVGSIVFFGTFISVIGASLLDSVSDGVRRSITQSIAGDAQIWSAEKGVAFSVFGDAQTNDFPDIGQIPDFPAVKKAIVENIPNVKAVIPQGINLALFNPNTILDRLLTDLRLNLTLSKEERSDLREHIRAIIADLGASYEKNTSGFLAVTETEKEVSRTALAKALSNEFWKDFDNHSAESIDFLENKIAPLSFNDAMSFFYYVGTTPDEMMKAFPLIELVKGEPIPPGQRGFLFNEYVYEKQIKHKIAVRLDEIQRKKQRSQEAIEGSTELQQKIDENVAQSSDIYNQISPNALRNLEPDLRKIMNTDSGTVAELIPKFLEMNDANFDERFTFFYAKIAPVITLYRMKVGDSFPLTAVSRSGSPNSVNVKLWGIFRFRSIENSPVSGYFSLMDLITFRQLYGYMTPERRRETEALSIEMANEISGEFDKSDVDAIFSQRIISKTKAEAVVTSTPDTKLIKREAIFNGTANENRELNRTYSLAEMEDGVTPNAALVLHDSKKLPETLSEIRTLFQKKDWKLKVEPWIEVTGVMGQMAFVIRTILILFLTIVYFVGAFIIANAVLMSTMLRTREIGVIRALGGQRSFIWRLITSEVLLMSAFFGALGVSASLILIAWLARIGIPAPNEVFEFVFSGPRLILSISPWNVLFSYLIGVIVSIAASLYPVTKAIRVPPITAMQAS